MIVDQKIYRETKGKALEVKEIHYEFNANPSFLEKLLFLFGKKKIYVDNEMNFVNGVMHINNHIKFLNLNA